MEVGKALEQLDQLRRERHALGQFYDDLLGQADRYRLAAAEGDEATLDDEARLLIQQLAAAVRTERDHSRLLLRLLVDAYQRLLGVLGVPSHVERAA